MSRLDFRTWHRQRKDHFLLHCGSNDAEYVLVGNARSGFHPTGSPNLLEMVTLP